MTLAEYRAQLVLDLANGVPAGVKVAPHPGRFTLEEIERYSMEAPCVRVAVLSAADADLSELFDVVEVGAYILTKTGKAGLPDVQLLTLGTGLKAYVRAFPIGGGDASSAQGVKFSNLFSTAIGKQGVALGAVTWRQKLALDQPDTSSLADFLTFYGTFDVGQSAGSPAAIAEADLPSA